jgi:antitoxin PrlF
MKNCCEIGKDTKDQEAYNVEAIVTIDERGQMVLPKDIRARLGVRPGDKLAVVTMERQGKVCCLHLFKAGELSGEAKNLVRASGPARSLVDDQGAAE